MTALICTLCVLNVASSAYVAFGAITSLSSLALYASYAIAIGSMLYARYTTPGGVQLGEWNFGRWGLFINWFAMLYTLWMMIFLPFPSTLPVTATNMNYCGLVFVAAVICACVLWLAGGNKHWRGPNTTIIDFVLANS